MLVRKLELDRDFTRFLNDPTFPYKVTVCIGEERILCSGVLLAQQSSLLEQKFREDNGVLMFEEMLDVDGGSEGLNKCIRFLHGADVDLSIEDFAVCVKFASLFQVKDLFNYCLQWLKERFKYFYCSSSVKEALSYLKLSHVLNMNDSESLRSEIRSFIRSFASAFSLHIIDLIDEDILGVDIITILNENLEHSSEILKNWALLSTDNQNFIIQNHDTFDLKIFSNEEEFSSFMCLLYEGTANSNESFKALFNLQKKYFTLQLTKSPAPPASRDSGISNSSTALEYSWDSVRNLLNESAVHSRTLLITNLPPKTTPTEIEQTFWFAGEVASVKLLSQCEAELTYENVAYAHYLLWLNFLYDSIKIENNVLAVFPTFEKNILNSFDFQDDQVSIWNIPNFSGLEIELRKLFSFGGRIKSIDIFPQNFFAVITYHSVKSAKAVSAHGFNHNIMMDGRPLLVINSMESHHDVLCV